jgi:mono/diheme cytochrome c family protein
MSIPKSIACAAVAALFPAVALAAGDVAAGKAKYGEICVTCHGPGGKGDGPAAPADPKPRDFTVGDFKYDTDKDGKAGTDADLANVIKNGAGQYSDNPLSALMAPWGGVLSDQDVQNVIAYVRSLKQ